MTWRIVKKSLLIGKYKPGVASSGYDEPYVKRRKIAAFDFVCLPIQLIYVAGCQVMLTNIWQDSTLIRTSSGNVFGRDASDWQWWHISVPGTLKALYNDG